MGARNLQFICYEKCSTCKKARNWLDEHGVPYEVRPIREQNPTVQELDGWSQESGLPLRRFFNTSGQLYQAMGLKDKLDGMTRQEQLELLASDGMLVKRPLLVGDGVVLVGFRPEQWDQALNG
ncbi:MAG TPA: arsenate reductase family protein [Candidatus Enterenecus stercoripullorum]|nr:arsenate reductase family protein [Candidatus Enterenecus stercoripullorum]